MADLVTHAGDEPNDAETVESVVAPELFREWRSPRVGASNPQRMDNPVWEWLVKSKISAYRANERFNGPSAFDVGPGWCFQRFGQSINQLPDGRVIFIAGEHEDYYDPDFYIYNDVVVQHPDGRINIFGYPHGIFPPTDFHSATVVGNRIVLIGSLGYPNERRPPETAARILDLDTLAISTVRTSGTPPGWIHRHKATLSEDSRSILVEGGKLDRGERDKSLVENIDDWQLHLTDWRWERLTERRWPRWQVHRKDGERNHLFHYRQALWNKQFPDFGKLARVTQRFDVPSLQGQLGKLPDLDLFTILYRPSVMHEALAGSEDEYNVHRIKVEGVVVRYVESAWSVQMTVEGELPQEILDALTHDLIEKLSVLENVSCELVHL
jgi:hypothetical protein